MVSGNGEGRLRMPLTQGLLCPGGGVIDRRAALQPLLEFCAVFSNVVEDAGKLGFALGVKCRSEGSGKCGGVSQVFCNGLGTGLVFTDMSKQFQKNLRNERNFMVPIMMSPYDKDGLLSIGRLSIVSV